MIRAPAWAGALLLCYIAKNAWQVHHGTCTMAAAKICNSTSRTTIEWAASDQRAQTVMRAGLGARLCTHKRTLQRLLWTASRQGGIRGNAPAVMQTEATLQQTARQHSRNVLMADAGPPCSNGTLRLHLSVCGVRPAAGCTGGERTAHACGRCRGSQARKACCHC